MSKARHWTCRKCKAKWPRTKRLCTCGTRRPERKTASQKALSEPYEVWVARFGEACNICGAEAKTRRLSRDHDHATGKSRGILCTRCNRALPTWCTAEWLRKAADYLERG